MNTQEHNGYIGAFDDRSPDEKAQDFRYDEIASGIPQVNWVEKRPVGYTPRNQDGSGSCVAQTVAKMLEIADFKNDKETTIYSATPVYQNRRNKPAPGMSYVDALSQPIKSGTRLERDVPSQNMGDSAMDNEVIDGGDAPVRPLNYIVLPTDFETVAYNVQKYGSAMVWVKSSYEEWCKDVPEGKSDSEAVRHSVTAVDCILYKGKKYLIIEDSWGTWQNVSDIPLNEGQRAISEEFFLKHFFFAGTYLTFNYEGMQGQRPSYRWLHTMKYGDVNEDVRMLQVALQYLGFFPKNVECTGKFLSITARALRDFQVSMGINDFKDEKDVRKIRAYTKTITKLNDLFAPQTGMTSTARSFTQQTNFVALAGIITLLLNSLLKKYGIVVAESDVVNLIGALVTLGGIVANYIHRYNKGDVTSTGKRKG